MPADTRYGFPRADWEAAKAHAKAILAVRAHERRTITYAELCREIEAITLKPRSWALMAFLDEVCTEEDAAHGIMLASLVVRADTGIPGDGYFRYAARLGRDVTDSEAYWRSEVERIYATYADGA
jgi:hypothetical protein